MAELRSYAQNREDIYINWLLGGKSKGFYVDVGANDPVHESVTKFFYDKGWRGINIEPIEHHYSSLKTERTKDINVQLGVSNKPGELVFREFVGADGLSTLDPGMQSDQKAAHRKSKDYEIKVEPLSLILEKNLPKNQKIDFLKIDVEGYEYEVISSNNWKKFRPMLVVVEANHVKHDWRPLLTKAGYKQVFFDGLNEYYGLEEIYKKDHRATYPEFIIGQTIIDTKEQAYADWRERLGIEQTSNLLKEQIEKERKAYEAQLAAVEQRALHLEQLPLRQVAIKRTKHLHVRVRQKLLWLQQERPMAQKLALPEPAPESEPKLLVSTSALIMIKRADINQFLLDIEGHKDKKYLVRQRFFGETLRAYDGGIKLLKVAGRTARKVKR
ncbi:MAG: FkbM family methyltransferase [Patescibacteria group bacterium]|nr:FkbM family methyltransferase [Patescibacteria group bacterium]